MGARFTAINRIRGSPALRLFGSLLVGVRRDAELDGEPLERTGELRDRLGELLLFPSEFGQLLPKLSEFREDPVRAA